MSEITNTNNVICYNCQKALALEPSCKILRSEECPHCFASLHCCKMCHFYDTTAYNECREPTAERIVDKEKANFCEYFILNGDSSGNNGPEDLLAAANNIFKD